jgi:hypothetical protein
LPLIIEKRLDGRNCATVSVKDLDVVDVGGSAAAAAAAAAADDDEDEEAA